MAFSAAPTSCAGSGGLGRHDRKFQPWMGNDGKENNKSVILHCQVAKTVGGQLIVFRILPILVAVDIDSWLFWGSREPAWSGWWSAVWAALVFWRCWECGLNSSPGPQRASGRRMWGRNRRWITSALWWSNVAMENPRTKWSGGFNRKILCKWWLLHCHLWLPKGIWHKPVTSITLMSDVTQLYQSRVTTQLYMTAGSWAFQKGV